MSSWSVTGSLGARWVACAVFCALLGGSEVVLAADDGARGILLAKQGKCDQAIPLLEQSELAAHRPTVMLALADCHAKQGDLLAAFENYKALADEKPTRRSSGADLLAFQTGKRKAAELEVRIPTVQLDVVDTYPGLEVSVDGTLIGDLSKPVPLNPTITAKVTALAKGYRRWEKEVTLSEKERLVLEIRLVRGKDAGKGTDKDDAGTKKKKDDGPSSSWIGVAGRAYILPKFMMGAFAEGGRTSIEPGGGIVYTSSSSGFDLVFSLNVINYRLSSTPIKQKGAPDTDWEIVSSSLTGLQAELDFLWNTPIDEGKTLFFRYGFGVGVGYMIAGALRRTQAYLPNGLPNDPYLYQPCNGPNDPANTWVYCNALDKDAKHYRYEEPDWFHGGKKPSLYPWAALPKIGLTYKPSRVVALDTEVGFSLAGFLTSLGLRFRL